MNKDIYLTFKTDYKTHYYLKTFARKLGKTQPEFINEICKYYIESILEDMEKMIEENKNSQG